MTTRTKKQIGKASKARGKRAELDLHISYRNLDLKLEEPPSIVARLVRQMLSVCLEYIVNVKRCRD